MSLALRMMCYADNGRGEKFQAVLTSLAASPDQVVHITPLMAHVSQSPMPHYQIEKPLAEK